MKRLILATGAAVLVAIPASVEAQDTEWNRYTLEEIGGVYVSTEATAACEAAGVTASSVEADAALKLLDGEVDLLTQEEMLANPGLPELRISLSCVAGNGGAVAYSVALRVQQAAQMVRDNQVTLAEAVTWYTTDVGVASGDGAGSAIKSALDAKLMQFAAAYASANATDATGSN